MKIVETELLGVFEIDNFVQKDERGSFVKTFNSDAFKKEGFDFEFKESFYSVSQKNVIRGMHFQVPPFDHEKLVYVVAGEVIDVVVDVRKNSPAFGQYLVVNLSAGNCKSLLIGKGFAHGFLTITDKAVMHYSTTSVYSKDHDRGIKWDCFGYDWPVSKPIVSDRDQNFDRLT